MFRVRLGKLLRAAGTIYRASRDTKLHFNTVKRYYEEDEVYVAKIDGAIYSLARYVDRDWKDVTDFIPEEDLPDDIGGGLSDVHEMEDESPEERAPMLTG